MTVVYTIMRSTPFTYPELIEISCKEVEAQKVINSIKENKNGKF